MLRDVHTAIRGVGCGAKGSLLARLRKVDVWCSWCGCGSSFDVSGPCCVLQKLAMLRLWQSCSPALPAA